MTYYRIIPEIELDEIKQKKYLDTSSNDWYPYPSNTIINVFESDDPNYICTKYAITIADNRELKPGECLYMIKIEDPPGIIEIDKSQNDFPESRAHHGPIPIKHIIVTKQILLNIKADMRKIKKIIHLKKQPIINNGKSK